jgi:hypothetical protein
MDRKGSGPQLAATGQATVLTPAPAGPSRPPPLRRATARPAVRQLALLAVYLTAGVAVTWPRVTYLAGRLPAIRDTGGYVWDFWWVARQVTHLSNPWFTGHMAAPLGSWLGFHTLMPLPGLLLTPVTLICGPSAAYNLLAVVCPGLLCYAMYRAARLWLPPTGAVAAGAFFGLSTILTWRSWYQVNLAAGAIFFPLALAAAVQLRRSPGLRRALMLGLILAAALLTDQESAVMAGIVATLALLPWLGLPWRGHASWRAADPPGRAWLRRLALAGTAMAVAAVLGAPQLLAMAQPGEGSGGTVSAQIAVADYIGSGAGLLQLFAPSPRLAGYGMRALAAPYYQGGPGNMVVVGYGVMLTALALTGLVVAWRRRSARLLALLWAACSVLALGISPWIGSGRHAFFGVRWHGVWVSPAMPFTWFVRLPGLANFREADRFTELGLVGAALLAGAAVAWLATRSRVLLAAVAVLALLEAGWPGNQWAPHLVRTMPTAMPALDRPIAADRSGSIVVDVPFGIRGGLPVIGGAFPPQTMVLATADGHPRGEAYVSRISKHIRRRITTFPFYAGLLRAQGSPFRNSPTAITAARISARRLRIGWVVDWENHNLAVTRYLEQTGFRLAYRADGADVYRPWSPLPAATSPGSVPPR